MALVNMRDMLYHAYRNGYAVGAFDLVSLEFLEGVMAAAERCRSPVILSLAESHFDYFDFELIMPAVEAAARRSSVPVAIHLNHAVSLDSAVHGINLGCNGIMADAPRHDSTENIRITRTIVDMAHACGIPVEGELGYVMGTHGGTSGIVYPSADRAKTYVEQTDVDFLSVPISDMHERMGIHGLNQINEALKIPLAINAGFGLSSDQFQRLIASGVAKINYDTDLADAADASIQDNAMIDRRGGYISLTEGVKDAITVEVERCMHLCGSIDRAGELLTQCTPWAPVEHLIIYNVTGRTEYEVNAMIAEGRRALSAIPGVREVVTGHAIKEDAKYQYTWLVRFCHPAVIGSYRDHPNHVAFADQHFRPVAADRVSIDYQHVDTPAQQSHEVMAQTLQTLFLHQKYR